MNELLKIITGSGITLLFSFVGFVYGYAKLQGRVESLEKDMEKQFSDNGRIGKLEKYSGLHFDSTNKLNEAQSAQTQINIKMTDRMELLGKEFSSLSDKIEDHIKEDAKTADMIRQIHGKVMRGQ